MARRDSLLMFFAYKKMLGRTETRTRDRIHCQTIRTVRYISRDNRARIATCSLRTSTDRQTDRLKENYRLQFKGVPQNQCSAAMGHWICADRMRCALCTYPRNKGRGIYSLSSSSPACAFEGSALFFRSTNFSHPNMHISLNRKGLHHCCPSLFLARDFTIARTSYDFQHTTQCRGVSLESVVVKLVLDPSSSDHRNAGRSRRIWLQCIPPDRNLKVSADHVFIECFICWR